METEQEQALAKLKKDGSAGARKLAEMLERFPITAGVESKPPTPYIKKSGSLENIPSRYKREDIPPSIEKLFTALGSPITHWISGMNDGFPGWLIHGPLGVGKTSFALLAGWNAFDHGKIVRFEILWDIVSHIKESWNERSKFSEREAVDFFIKPDLLIVDDAGVQFQTHAERNILYRILVGRYNYMKPTILTTNCDLNTEEGRFEFYESVGVRVADRFKGFVIDSKTWGGNLR